MKKVNRYYMLAVLTLLSFSYVLPAPADSWYQRVWQSIRPYFGWIAGGSAAGAVAGAGIAQRYKMNPCVGAACGAVAGGLLVGGGSALLASRIDKEAEEYVQNLSALLRRFAAKTNILTFLNDNTSLVDALLESKYAMGIEYEKANGVNKIVELIMPWKSVKDKISNNTFDSFIDTIVHMLITFNTEDLWGMYVEFIDHIYGIVTGSYSNTYFKDGDTFAAYNAEHMNAIIKEIKQLKKEE